MKHIISVFFFVIVSAFSIRVDACSPFGTPVLVSQNISGGNLNLVWRSNTAWACSYWINMEVVCQNQSFTGTSNFTSPCLVKGSCYSCSGSQYVYNYPTWSIPLSNFCPGVTYIFRAKECYCDDIFSCSGWSSTFTFTVPGVLAVFTPTATATTIDICVPDNTTLTANTTGGCGPFIYSWAPGGETTSSITVAPTVATTYTVTVQDVCTAQSASASITINILPPPVVGMASVNPASVCTGDPTTLTLIGSTGNIQWQSGPTNTGPWTNIAGATTAIFNTVGLTTATCFRAELTGCLPIVYSNAVCVAIKPIPTLIINNVTVCLGQNATLTATPNLPGGSYLWSNASITQNITVSPPTTTVYTVVYTLNGCPSIPGSGTVSINPLPIADFTFADVCLNEFMSFNDISTISSGSITGWSWIFGGGNTSNVQNPTNTYLIPSTFNVQLTATSALGCTGSITKQVRVNPLPVAAFSATVACININTVFTDNSTVSNGTIASYSWDFGDGSAYDITPNPSHLYPNTNPNYTAELLVTSNFGCLDSISQTIQFHPLPIASFSHTDECLGFANSFTDLSTVSTGTITTRSWDFADNGTANAANPTHTYASHGIYNVRLIAGTNFGCKDTAFMDVEVYNLPVADFNYSPVCALIPIQFNDLSTIVTDNIDTWQWDFDILGSSFLQNPMHTFNVGGDYDVTLTVTTNRNCVHTLSQTITSYPIPDVLFSITNVCMNEPTVFTNQSSIASGTLANHLWNFGDTNTSALVSPSHIYAVYGFYNVKLIETSDFGCLDSLSLQAEVFPLPTALFTILPDVGCQPLDVLFTDASTIPAPYSIIEWLWNFGDSATSIVPTTSHIYVDAGIFYVSLKVTSANGCLDSMFNVPVTVHPKPIAGFSFEPESGKADILDPFFKFYDESIGADSGYWNMGDNIIIPFSSRTTHIFPDTGCFDVTQYVITRFGCRDTMVHPICISPAFVIYIPNAFTPNGDEVNDLFYGNGIGIIDYNMAIYDRWGMNIFNSQSMNNGWDGKVRGSNEPAKQDVYIYILKVKDILNKEHVFKGHVTVVR